MFIKSFIDLNNKKQIMNIEKKNHFRKNFVGLYSFQSAKDFEKHYQIAKIKLRILKYL